MLCFINFEKYVKRINFINSIIQTDSGKHFGQSKCIYQKKKYNTVFIFKRINETILHVNGTVDYLFSLVVYINSLLTGFLFLLVLPILTSSF